MASFFYGLLVIYTVIAILEFTGRMLRWVVRRVYLKHGYMKHPDYLGWWVRGPQDEPGIFKDWTVIPILPALWFGLVALLVPVMLITCYQMGAAIVTFLLT